MPICNGIYDTLPRIYANVLHGLKQVHSRKLHLNDGASNDYPVLSRGFE